ncbi:MULTISPECIES: BBE domain-containing protein [unclassified Streptomyces]|uniref:BBE domain-containing protein n=1 Tax=unclassified Streptomyces TaxID=2593676 RepID=UPI00333011A1
MDGALTLDPTPMRRVRVEPEPRSPGAPEPRTAGVGGGSRAFRGNCDRPAAVKRACDPDDFFRVNQNIPPA